MQSKTKVKIWALIITASFLSGLYVGNTTRPDVVHIQDVKPPKYKILKQPQTASEYIEAFNSPIQIERVFEYPFFTITASDGYKQTKVVDRISITPKKHFIFCGAGVDSKLNRIFSVGFTQNIFSGLYIGGVFSLTSNLQFSSQILAGVQL